MAVKVQRRDGAPRGVARALAQHESRLDLLRAQRSSEYEALLSAARRVLLRRGYEATRVEDIMREARISTRAFYRFCAGKDALFLTLFERANGAAIARLRRRVAAATRPAAQLGAYIDAMLELGYRRSLREETQLFLSVPHDLAARWSADVMTSREQLTDVLREIIAAGKASGDFPDGEPDEDAWAILGAVSETMMRIVRAASPAPRAEVSARLRRFCLAALGGAAL